ncbi:MAG TPA: hypothetical protein VHF47_01980 [Acidimicrobiales bacterium]|nr:hypothetical protein [Acidimicrobiales bacterium]
MAEYFGGILAASRSADPTADRGLTWASLVARLATHDVLFHYVLYSAFRAAYADRQDLDLGDINVRRTCKTFLPVDETFDVLGLDRQSWRLLSDSVIALERESLIELVTLGARAYLQPFTSSPIPDDGLMFVPTAAGLQLFLWAHGHGHQPSRAVLSEDLEFVTHEELRTVEHPSQVASS